MIDPDGKFFIMGSIAAGYEVYTLGTAAIATAYILGQYLKDFYDKNKTDQDLFNENKRMYKKSKDCKRPKQVDPDKDPVPPLAPTLKQKLKREPWWSKLWRAIKAEPLP